MCFSQEYSIFFATIGCSATAYLAYKGSNFKTLLLLGYFSAMELLQLAQYQVLGQCDSKLNQFLTLLAYIHVCFQPVVLNNFAFSDPRPPFVKRVFGLADDSAVRKAILRLCMASSVMLLAKGFPAMLQLLNIDSPWSQALTDSCVKDEIMCGAKLCSIPGTFHLGWSVPQATQSYYIPSSHMHFFFFHVPMFVLGSHVTKFLAIMALITGSLASQWIVSGNPAAEQYEWAAIWCLFSLSQVFLLLACQEAGTWMNRRKLAQCGAAAEAEIVIKPAAGARRTSPPHRKAA